MQDKEWQLEEAHLKETIDIAQDQLDRLKGDIRKLDDDLRDLMDVYEADEKEGIQLWNNASAQLQETKHELQRYEKARKKPYFGRIVFRDPAMQEDETYYIGRVGIAGESSEPVVLDWRAPIASVYYESHMGKCQYTVTTEGNFEVDLKGKRTYEIEKDHLKDFFDSDVVANDELLTKYLAKHKKAVLGEIIATIQEEQNQMIRRSPKTNIIVQGVAGSGKTTVAMHRISYILYNYADEFKPEDFYIIGSNQILLNYITSVLPELDVYGVKQMTMEELFARLLYEDWDDTKYRWHRIAAGPSGTGAQIKGSQLWFEDLAEFCDAYERAFFTEDAIYMEETGNLLIGRSLIDNYLRSSTDLSMQSKILMLNEILYSKYENEVLGRDVSFPPKVRKSLDKKYANYFGDGKWDQSIYAFYQEFLRGQLEKGMRVEIPEGSFDIYDLAALAYIYKRIKETDPIREASHVVIDEAQDFGMMVYECLHYCMRSCTYTIMGDTSQNIHYDYGLNDWDALRKLVLTGTYDAFGLLRKSYRNTVEISEYANEILRHGEFAIYPVEPIIRHGREVEIVERADQTAVFVELVQRIKHWQRDGYETIAVICRDQQEAEMVSQAIGAYVELELFQSEQASFGEGIMVLPIADTKGLEFDTVLLYDPTEEKYPLDNGNVKLLYVAATRALHELVIVHRGNLCRILCEKVAEDKQMRAFSTETLTKAKEYERQQVTKKEEEQQLIRDGNREMKRRENYGPKRIAAAPAENEEFRIGKRMSASGLAKKRDSASAEDVEMTKNRKIASMRASGLAKKRDSAAVTEPELTEKKPLVRRRHNTSEIKNTSEIAFGTNPDTALLRVRGHARVSYAVRWAKKTRTHVDLASAVGILRLIPIAPDIVRVCYVKGINSKLADNPWQSAAEETVRWSVKETKMSIDLQTEILLVRVDKRTGAVQFFDHSQKVLLEERADEPRLIEGQENWVFFHWDKSERIKAKGVLATDLMDVRFKARYISFGGMNQRMPLVLSNKGYGIAVAAEHTTLLCDISTYGRYIYNDESSQIDYYFLYGGTVEHTIERYRTLE